MITQGKWELIENTGDVVVRDKTGQTRICHIIEHAPRHIKEDKSNAALICAAPELLEACNDFITGWGHFLDIINFSASFFDAKAIQFMNEVPGKIQQAAIKAASKK